MSKKDVKSLAERLSQAAEGSLHLGPETRVKRDDAAAAAKLLREIAEAPKTQTMQVTNG